MKTAELEGPLLDYWVGRAMVLPEEVEIHLTVDSTAMIITNRTTNATEPWSPSTDWRQGGQIIQHQGISLERHRANGPDCNDPLTSDGEHYWIAEWNDRVTVDHRWSEKIGPTPLIAAMRAYVAGTLGDEVADHDDRELGG